MATAELDARSIVARAEQIGWAVHQAGEGLFDPRHDIEIAEAADVRDGRPLVSLYVRDENLPDHSIEAHLYSLVDAGLWLADAIREAAGCLAAENVAQRRFVRRVLRAADRIAEI